MAKNSNLSKAKTAKNDEFYTQLSDVEKELKHYKEHFKDKIVFCNCDDPEWSAFWKYFHLNFNHLGLKKLISTHYVKEVNVGNTLFNLNPDAFSYKMEYTGGNDDINVGIKTKLKGNGDFKSEECIELLKECDIVVTNPPFSCYSFDTEVMTNSGWKLIKDVDIEKDTIMSLNPDNKQIEMVNAIDYICTPVNGNLYHYHNRNMDFCVTGNHRMYTSHKKSNGSIEDIPFINAEDIKKNYLLPLADFVWVGNRQDYFYLPKTTQIEQYSRKEITVAKKKIPMKDWLEFFGFYLADGCYRDHINTYGKRDYTISIKQNKSNEDYVLNLIERIGFKARISGGSSDNSRNYNIYSKQLWEYLLQFGRSADKYIPREFLDLDTEYLKALYKGYLSGDGSLCADGHIHYSTVSKKLIENIQELILKIYGRVVQCRKYTRKHSYDDNYGTCYSINIDHNKKHDNYSKYGVPERVTYNDNVYCLTLEKNHIMLVRHNGIIGWCGNCFRDYVAQLMEYDKKFLIIGNMNAITYKEIFPLIRDNKMWVGANEKGGTRKGNSMCFAVPDGFKGKTIDVGGIPMAQVSAWWFTNLDFAKRHQKYIFWKNYTSEEYPKYDNYDAIDCGHSDKVPCDYDGVIGVPISFLNGFYNPEQFEIVAFRKGEDGKDLVFTRERESSTVLSYPCTTSIAGMIKNAEGKINGKPTYARITIRRKLNQ